MFSRMRLNGEGGDGRLGSAPVELNYPVAHVPADRRHVFFKCGAHTKPAIEPRARSPGSLGPERDEAFSVSGKRIRRPQVG